MIGNFAKFIVWLVVCFVVGLVCWRINVAGVPQAAVIPVGTFVGLTLFFKLFNQLESQSDERERGPGEERSVLVTSQRLWPTPLNTLASLLLLPIGVGLIGLAFRVGWVLVPVGAMQFCLGLASWGWVDVEVGEVRVVRAIRPHEFRSVEVQDVYLRSLHYVAP